MSSVEVERDSAQMNELKDEVVISGISGRFPESESIEEFRKNLFEGTDMVTEDNLRWPSGIYDMPSRVGKLKNIQYFDATFFGVHAKLAEVMDPQMRLIVEVTYEALIDAGVNPTEIRGSNIGVFVGSSGSDSDIYWTNQPENVNSYEMLGFCLSANRISYIFDFKGPSHNLDTGSSSGLYALQQAHVAIQTGQCDAAIVGGSNLVLDPMRSKQYHRLGVLSPEGKCKCFDASGDGYVRADGIVAIFLQKSRNAKRIYASILGAKTNADGYKEQGILYPSRKVHTKLIKDIYEENNINVLDVSYVEAHATGSEVGDSEEANTIADVFCKNRKNPLLIGGVTSNMGHSEFASALCALAKVLIATEEGMLPANLHFKTPNKYIPGLNDGRLKVVTKHEQFKGGLIGINSFGFGGANGHIIVKPNSKPKYSYKNGNIPRLIRVSGRTEESVDYFLNEAAKYQDDAEFLGLLDEIHSSNVNGHLYRGYVLLADHLVQEVSQIRVDKRPIWFVYSGMGSQWSGMAKDLMKFDVFSKSIHKSANALSHVGVDLKEIMLKEDDSRLNNILNNFVSIASMQIALTDLLSLLGIEPNGIIGHSSGEIGCAYGDGALTTEEAVLSAYARGRAVLDTKLPPGLMASVGLSLEEAKARCPPEVEISCHNGRNNVTISGPPDTMCKFISELIAENIFATKVDACGWAFHSKYVNDAGAKLRELLEKVIPCPKPRTSRWLSSSVPESEWTKPLAKLCSAEYFVNNFLNPVLFNEVLQHIPENAITIEIAPNGLMKAILERSLDQRVTNLSLVKKYHSNNLEFFLQNIGKLYVAGAQLKLHKLYPTVRFPVGRGTPNIASMIKLDHSIAWAVPNFNEKRFWTRELAVNVDLRNEEDSFLAGHFSNGEVFYPATGYLTLVWKTFARMRNENYEHMPVVFENVSIRQPTVIIPKEGSVKFLVNILEGSGDFEVCESGTPVVTGRIYVPEDPQKERLTLPEPEVPTQNDVLPLLTSDIYKQMKVAGYEYSGLFRGVLEVDNWGKIGKLKWENNWMTYMDSMLQVFVVGNVKPGFYVISRLQQVAIDPRGHLERVGNLSQGQGSPVYIHHDINVIQSGGIEFRGVYFTSATSNDQLRHLPKLEKYQFVPYENYLSSDTQQSQQDALTVLVQIVVENHRNVAKFKLTEILSTTTIDFTLLSKIKSIFEKEPMVSVETCVVTTKSPDVTSLSENDINVLFQDTNLSPVDLDCHLIILSDILESYRPEILSNVSASLRPGGFVLLEIASDMLDKNGLHCDEFTVVAIQGSQTNKYALLRKPIELPTDPIIIPITGNNFTWLGPLKAAMKKSETDRVKVYVYTQGEKVTGLIGMVNCLIREAGGENLRSFFIPDSKDPIFSISKYKNQLRKDLVHNIWKNGAWGSYRHLLLDTSKESSVLAVHAFVDMATPSDLSTLRWIQQPLAHYQGKESELCTVYYAAVNSCDFMITTGQLPTGGIHTIENHGSILGCEFSGRDANGKRVMGLLRGKCLTTSGLPHEDLMWPVPEHWTLEEATTVPVAYLTAYYTLIMRGRMKPEESILIHAGTGAVGQAAISLAINMRCTVFTTVSTQVERDFFKKTFPEVMDENIGYSRDTSFEQLVLSRTRGRGVDLVLNSLAGEQLQASAHCLAPGGRFLEMRTSHFGQHLSLGMSLFSNNSYFHGVLLDILFARDRCEIRELSRLLSEGIACGVVRPLPVTVYNKDQVEQASVSLSSRTHIGKIIIKLREEETSHIRTPDPTTVSARSYTYMYSEKSYIIVGGLSKLGLELTKWLIRRGARKLILVARGEDLSGYQSWWLRQWRESGIHVVVSNEDVTTEDGAQNLLEEANKMGPVGGIFNLATVLRDDLVKNQTEENFRTACNFKVNGTKYLDIASRRVAPQLDHFVCSSSISSGRGKEGQSNYGFANSAMERLCEARQEVGLPGLAIQWGAIEDMDWIAEGTSNREEMEIKGTIPQKISSCLAVLDLFMQQNHPVVGSLVVTEKKK